MTKTLPILFLALSGCYTSSLPEVNLQPDVIVDASFDSIDVEGISVGLSLWENAGVGASFTLRTMPHDEILTVAKGTSHVNTIYVLRADMTCPTGDLEKGMLGTTKRTVPVDGIEVVCLLPHVLPVTVAHEIGHAFGLEHDESPAPAIMKASLETASSTVTPRDVAAIRAIWPSAP